MSFRRAVTRLSDLIADTITGGIFQTAANGNRIIIQNVAGVGKVQFIAAAGGGVATLQAITDLVRGTILDLQSGTAGTHLNQAEVTMQSGNVGRNPRSNLLESPLVSVEGGVNALGYTVQADNLTVGSWPKGTHLNGTSDGANATPNFTQRRDVWADLIPVGSIIAYAHPSAPVGFLVCDGSAVLRTDYVALFELIGTTYGPGDGATTFNLPDLRGKFPMGLSATHPWASTGGAELLPDHNHGSGTYAIGGTSLNQVATTTAGGNTNRLTAPDTHSHGISGNSGIVIGANPSVLNPFLAIQYLIRSGVI